MPRRFFENQYNEICRHLGEQASKGSFLGPISYKNHINEGKGKENKKEQGGRKEEKRKKQWLHSKFLAEKNCWTQKVHLAVKFSKIRLDISIPF